jgi:uncharacterized protein
MTDDSAHVATGRLVPEATEKLTRLQALFQELGPVLVAFSGGIDSTLVFKVAHETLGRKATAVTAVSPTYPASELEGARRLAAEIGGQHIVIQTDQLEIPAFVQNNASRCYHCKTDLYQALDKMRHDLKADWMVDGTNLDDLGDDRPGILAAREWRVRSPLVEVALNKEQVRQLARHVGLSNWDKPAAACLSSRIPRGMTITKEALSRVELAEAVLMEEGFRQFRVRDHQDLARIELGTDELARMTSAGLRDRMVRRLKELGYRFVTLDLQGYRRGGGN